MLGVRVLPVGFPPCPPPPPRTPEGTLPQWPKAVGISHHNVGPWDANSSKGASSDCGRRPTASSGEENKPRCPDILVAPCHPPPLGKAVP